MSPEHETLGEGKDQDRYLSRGEVLNFLVGSIRDYMEWRHICLASHEVRMDDLIHLPPGRKQEVFAMRERVLQAGRDYFRSLKIAGYLDPTWLNLEEASIEAQIVAEALEHVVDESHPQHQDVAHEYMDRAQLVAFMTATLQKLMSANAINTSAELTTEQREMLVEKALFHINLLLSEHRIAPTFFKNSITQKVALVSECIDRVLGV